MSDQQKKIAMVAGGLVLLFLAYRWYQNQQTSTTSTGVQAPDASTASDYAALAGQEQADVAGLQGQLSSMGAQETSDVAAATGQEASDVSGLTASINSLTGMVGDITTGLGTLTTSESGLQTEVTSIAAGLKQVNRQQATQTIQTHKGGPFYNYYVRLTGHAPPATVQVTNAIYQMWKAGVKTAPATHPSAPKQTQVAHPNGNHAQQKPVKPPPPKPVAPKPPAATKPKPPPPKPAAKTKPKPSGVRR